MWRGKKKRQQTKSNENAEEARSNDFHLVWIETLPVVPSEQHDKIKSSI